MRFTGSLCMAAVFLLAGTATADSLTVTTDASAPEFTTALTGFATTGAMMDGMNVTAFFSDGTSETLAWADTGPISGGVAGSKGGGWSLSLSGDSYYASHLFGGYVFGQNFWFLDNDTGLGINRVLIDAGSGDSVFDRYTGAQLSPDSADGGDFMVNRVDNGAFLPLTLSAGPDGSVSWGSVMTGTGLDIRAIYRTPVGIGAAAPVGDLWRYLDINFVNQGGFATGRLLEFGQDTDNLKFAGDLTTNPIPEPGTLGLFALGLGAAFYLRRRRNV